MKSKRDELLSIMTYDEFDKRREEFEDIEWDSEMSEHIFNLSPEVDVLEANIGMLSSKEPFKARALDTNK